MGEMNHELIVTVQANGLAPPAWRQVFRWILVPKPTRSSRMASGHRDQREGQLTLRARVLLWPAWTERRSCTAVLKHLRLRDLLAWRRSREALVNALRKVATMIHPYGREIAELIRKPECYCPHLESGSGTIECLRDASLEWVRGLSC